MEKQTIKDTNYRKLFPHLLVGLLWSIFSIWVCFREDEYYWSILLVFLGFLPIILEFFYFKSHLIYETKKNSTVNRESECSKMDSKANMQNESKIMQNTTSNLSENKNKSLKKLKNTYLTIIIFLAIISIITFNSITGVISVLLTVLFIIIFIVHRRLILRKELD